MCKPFFYYLYALDFKISNHINIQKHIYYNINIDVNKMIVIDKPTSCFNWSLIERDTFPAEYSTLTAKEDFHLLFQEHMDPIKLKETLRSSTRDPNQGVRKFLWKRILLSSVDSSQLSTTIEKYKEKISILFGKNLTLEAELPVFVDIDHLVYYYLNSEGKSAVKRILNVLASAHPDITFAPLLLPLVSLFLHYMSEAECYACLLAVVESKNKITQTDIHWTTTNHVFRRIAQKYAHHAYEYVLETLYKTIRDPKNCFEIVDNWIWWIFEYLPFGYVLNIVDSFLLEGQKVLFRYGISILDSFYKSLAANRPLTLERTFMKDYCSKTVIPFENLIKIAFGWRKMKRKDIENLFQAEEKAIKKQRAKNTTTTSQPKKRPLFGSMLKPSAPIIETIESDPERSNFCSSNTNLKQNESLSPICRASIFFSDALKSLRLTTKKWHQTSSHMHNLSFYHNHHPQSNLNLPSFSVENIGSTILRPQQIATLWKWLPTRYQILELEVIYSTNIHGCRLMTLFDKIEYYNATIIVVQTDSGCIFGAFCSQPWSNRFQSSITSRKASFFGNGETFLFELAPKVKKYDWIGIDNGGETTSDQEMFMYADNEKLIVGGGTKGIGLCINSDLVHGKTGVCDTYDNEILGTESDFVISAIEVLSFS